MPVITVVQVKALCQDPSASNDWAERRILSIECKRPSMDTPADWDNTVMGLYASDRLFGALAIGKKVRFYRFNGELPDGEKLVPLHQGTIDIDDPTGITQVEKILDYIKANG
ncbi:hypothetical protein P168DRAFT_19638 [Aspergillus campestris IBT 28561]|uniref:Uncharacterized protein n=1 Tax=Aspergillus campestris (strain IBT 28561) TaxID=1392248 RepID=A0A2I1DFF5_ASPC2|nr:uncharacterized protein P168DRAFT_19638 [Aspergillus campestris IBT 28561]PKY08598.1 hypothetical protein P168DRAFT_19638 [Aspergillus campestris IBT 28561]